MKKFEIRVNFKNGYTIEQVKADTFAQACVKVEGIINSLDVMGKMLINPIRSFELVDHAKMNVVFEPVQQHDSRFCIQED